MTPQKQWNVYKEEDGGVDLVEEVVALDQDIDDDDEDDDDDDDDKE